MYDFSVNVVRKGALQRASRVWTGRFFVTSDFALARNVAACLPSFRLPPLPCLLTDRQIYDFHMAELLAALRADEPDRFKRWFLVQKCLGRPNEEL